MRNAVVSQPSQRPDNDLESLRSQIGHLEDKLRKENDSKKNLELQVSDIAKLSKRKHS